MNVHLPQNELTRAEAAQLSEISIYFFEKDVFFPYSDNLSAFSCQ